MDRLIEILEELNPDVDYNTVENLIDGRYLDSLKILSLIAEIEDEFDVEIPTVEIIPANFGTKLRMTAKIAARRITDGS